MSPPSKPRSFPVVLFLLKLMSLEGSPLLKRSVIKKYKFAPSHIKGALFVSFILIFLVDEQLDNTIDSKINV